MLRTKLSFQTIKNLTVDLATAKSHLAVIHTELDTIIESYIETATLWASELTNKGLGALNVVYTQDTPLLRHWLLFDAIESVDSVTDFITGEVLEYTLSADKSMLYLDSEASIIVTYKTLGESQAGINTAILDYILMRFNGQTDKEAREQVYDNLFPYIDNVI